MRYHQKKPELYYPIYGQTYSADNPIYVRGTLFKEGNKGLVVIQQRYRAEDKSTWWDEIDPWLRNDIYLNPGFFSFFETYSSEERTDGFNVVTVRQIMWALRMKPIKREKWETVFDRKPV